MAENKKSVLLYCDLIHTVEGLSDEEAGNLFKHFLRYINDQNPSAETRLTALLFEPIKQSLKRDLKKWEDKSLKNSESARKRWDANASERIKPDAKYADSVKVSVSVNDIYKELNESEIWLDQTSHVLQSKSRANTQRLLKNWFTEKQATNELNGKSIDEIKRYFINSTKKLPLFEINKSLGHNLQGTL